MTNTWLNVTAIKRNMKGVPSSSHANVFTARITTNSIQGWIHTVQSSRPKPSFVNFTQVTHYVNQRNQSVTHLLKARLWAQWDSALKLIKEGTKETQDQGSCWNNAPESSKTALLVQKRSEWDNTTQTFPPCLKKMLTEHLIPTLYMTSGSTKAFQMLYLMTGTSKQRFTEAI